MIRGRGFSLLEMMVTLFMVGVMMLMVSQLVRDLRQETVNNRDYDQRIGAFQALDRVGLALRSCYRVDEPASGSSGRLRMTAWDPQENNARLPIPLAGPSTTWSPQDPSFFLQRTFEVSGRLLLCTNTRGAVSESVRLLGDLDSFQATRQSDGSYRLELAWTDSRVKARRAFRLSPAGPP